MGDDTNPLAPTGKTLSRESLDLTFERQRLTIVLF